MYCIFCCRRRVQTVKKKEKKKKDTDLDRAKILESIQIQDPGLKSILEPPTVSFESPDLDTNSIATTNTENFDMMDSFFKDVQPGLSKFLGLVLYNILKQIIFTFYGASFDLK